MFKDASDALKWTINTMLDKHQHASVNKREKWLKVAAYLEEVADLVDNSVIEFKKGNLPYGFAGQLDGASRGFSEVILEVLDQNDNWETRRLLDLL